MLIISIDEFGPGFPAMPVTKKSNSIYLPIKKSNIISPMLPGKLVLKLQQAYVKIT